MIKSIIRLGVFTIALICFSNMAIAQKKNKKKAKTTISTKKKQVKKTGTKKKKSSFDGAFVEKYDNSYQLGADVFPHSNWMMGYGAYGNDVTSDFEGNLDLDI